MAKKLDKLVKEQQELVDGATLSANDDGSVEVDLSQAPSDESPFDFYGETSHYGNLVDQVDEKVLAALGQKVIEDLDQDEESRSEWLSMIEFGLDLLGLKIEEKHVPFQGACSAQHPLLMESAVKFQSKASNELLPADGPVTVKVLGTPTIEKEEQANRVKNHMNYQITEEMTEFYPDSERLLLYTSLVGSGFKKTYYDAHLERPVSEFVTADTFVVPNGASDLFRSERYTHILYKTKYQLEADLDIGFYSKQEGKELGQPGPPKLTDVGLKTNELTGVEVSIGESANVYTLYEQHVECHIEGLEDNRESDYELSSPYVITVESESQQVIGIRRNWRMDDVKRRKKMMFTHYNFVPGFGFYSLGFLHLLGNLQLSLTSSLRSLVDAGQFANLQGGFKLKGVRIVDDGGPIQPGQFKEIESVIMDINKAIMPLPFKGADATLYSMLEFLDAKGQKFADSTEQVIADSNNNGPVGTTLALLDASTKFFSAIHKRLHSSLKHELKLIAEINGETLDGQREFDRHQETFEVTKEDYSGKIDVIPVSDANVSSSAHRMAKAQTMLQIAQQTPDLHDMREVLRRVYVNMDYAEVDKILPPEEEAEQEDPISDIKKAVGGKPIKAFEGQDHKSHIVIKQAFLQDPASGQNPMMQQASLAVQANIREHMLLNFVEQTQAQAANNGDQGQQQGSDPMAQAAQQVAQMNQQQLQKEQENQAGDEAGMMIAKAEMMDTQIEAKKQEFDEKHKIAQLELAKTKLDLEVVKEAHRMDEVDKKIVAEHDKILTTKGLDAMIDGLKEDVNVPVKSEPTPTEKPKKKE